MTHQETLEQCRAAVLMLRQIDQQLEHALPTGRPAGMRTQHYDAAPRTNDPAAAALQLYDGLKAQAALQAREVERLTAAALPLIMAAKSPRNAVILSHYYLLGMTDQEIARQQGLTREHVCRERRGALKVLH